jgi:hypothetical protein
LSDAVDITGARNHKAHFPTLGVNQEPTIITYLPMPSCQLAQEPPLSARQLGGLPVLMTVVAGPDGLLAKMVANVELDAALPSTSADRPVLGAAFDP